MEFACGQGLDLVLRRHQFAFVEIQRPSLKTALESFLFLLFLCPDSPQQVLDPRQQFARIERFGDIIVGAALKANNAVDLFVFTGDEDDAHVRADAKFAREGQAVFARQIDVDQTDVDVFGGDQRGDAFRIFLCHDAIAFLLKMGGQLRAGNGFIFNDE